MLKYQNISDLSFTKIKSPIKNKNLIKIDLIAMNLNSLIPLKNHSIENVFRKI
jgi:hypothetical protein